MAVTQEQLDMFRHVVQKIITPLIFVVGVMGNTLSIVVLTRKRMRCSTNVYLTGLAVSDLLYLVMYFIMSLRHYEIMHTYKMYYSLMGLFHWLIDSFSYISIYIVVSFTIERYIAVCHPIRGQRLCTEARAKKVIGIIAVVVMLSILSTAFEYQLNHQTRHVDKVTGKPCTINQVTNATAPVKRAASTASTTDDKVIQGFGGIPDKIDSSLIVEEEKKSNKTEPEDDEFDDVVPKNENEVNITQKPIQSNSTCVTVNYYDYKASALSGNQYYVIFYFATSFIYAGIPLILLITFNTFLIIAVRKSNKLRKDMTNNVNSRQIKQKISSMTQENKITITLIAVVILFIICQSPWVFTTIAMNFNTIDDNLERLISNIANLLVAINAAANFVLYCLLSDKYRKTVRELIMGHQYMRQTRMKAPVSDNEGLMKISPKPSSHSKGQSEEDETEEANDSKGINASRKDFNRAGTLSGSILSRQTTLGSSWYNRSWRHGGHKDSQKTKPHPIKGSPIPDHHHRPSFRPPSTNNFSTFDQNNFISIPEENERKMSDVSRINFVPTDHSISSVPNYPGERRVSSFLPPDSVNPSYLDPRTSIIPSTSFGPSDATGTTGFNDSFMKHRPSSFGPFDVRNPKPSNHRKVSVMSAMFADDKDATPFESYLGDSCSQHSLTRSMSLDNKPKIRHSPGCKDFPYNL